MLIDIFTLFPKMIEVPLNESILLKGQQKGLFTLRIHNIRSYSHDKHKKVDDTPCGGGCGMVLRPEPIFEGVQSVKGPDSWVILMSPQGRTLHQNTVRCLCQKKHLILICGHYEGVDNRVVEYLVDEEISIGDYILTNGSIAAVVLVDAVVRLIPGIVGDQASIENETFSKYHLKYPQYTKPADYLGMKVPEILLSGDHQKVEQWRNQKALEKTRQHRPDLIVGQSPDRA